MEKISKYSLKTDLIEELNSRKEEVLKHYTNGILCEIIDNHIPIYNGQLLDLVNEDLNFGFQGEFKISCDSGDVDIFTIIRNNTYEYLDEIAQEWINKKHNEIAQKYISENKIG